jgi:hypothetical protein
MLKLRVFAEANDPHRCGPVELRITDEGLVVGWSGDREFSVEWAVLIACLTEYSVEGPVL